MKTFFNRDTAPQVRTNAGHWSFDRSEEAKTIRHNLRVQRRVKQAVGEALALALFRVSEGRHETPEERNEIIPKHHTTTKRITRAIVHVSLDFLEEEGS